MTTQPVIVLLEDERPQLLAMRMALKGIGDLRDFVDPDEALEFVKKHTTDAAIVDVHMPQNRMDGIQFVRAVRQFDRDLCIILRTGDDSTELADEAIEVRAFRRAIKGKTSVAELRSLTFEALTETRGRRQVTRSAAGAARVESQLATTLGAVEDELSVSDGYKAMFQSLRNTLTAIAGHSEVLCEAARRQGNAFLVEQSGNNRALVGRLLAEVSAFLNSPFAESLRASHSQRFGTANSVLDSLRKRYHASPRWLVDGKSLTVAGLAQDMYVSTPPIRLLTALRHLVEFALARSVAGGELRLAAHCVENLFETIERLPDPKLILRRRTPSDTSAAVLFRLHVSLAGTDLEDVRRAFDEHPEDPRCGNLQMIGIAISDERASIAVHRTGRADVTVFDIYLPLAR